MSSNPLSKVTTRPNSPTVFAAYVLPIGAVADEFVVLENSCEESPFIVPTTCSPYFESVVQHMEFLKMNGYPALPSTAGQQYLSPQSPSPCAKLALRQRVAQQMSSVLQAMSFFSAIKITVVDSLTVSCYRYYYQ